MKILFLYHDLMNLYGENGNVRVMPVSYTHLDVYKRQGYVHAKTMVIDDELCCIGSVNMDIRSLKVDDEVCGVFYSSALVNQYIDIFKVDIQNSDEYSWEQFLIRGNKEKALESFFVLFAPLM